MDPLRSVYNIKDLLSEIFGRGYSWEYRKYRIKELFKATRFGIGFAMIFAPLLIGAVGSVVWIAWLLGWKQAVVTFAIIAAIFAWVFCAMYLMKGKDL